MLQNYFKQPPNPLIKIANKKHMFNVKAKLSSSKDLNYKQTYLNLFCYKVISQQNIK